MINEFYLKSKGTLDYSKIKPDDLKSLSSGGFDLIVISIKNFHELSDDNLNKIESIVNDAHLYNGKIDLIFRILSNDNRALELLDYQIKKEIVTKFLSKRLKITLEGN